jgi:hypothetical protein
MRTLAPAGNGVFSDEAAAPAAGQDAIIAV